MLSLYVYMCVLNFQGSMYEYVYMYIFCTCNLYMYVLAQKPI